MKDRVRQLTLDAIAEARQAYVFAPGSYTASAYGAVLAVHAALAEPDWTSEFLAWMPEAEHDPV